MATISVIIPTYNEGSWIESVLRSLWNISEIHEVIICDQTHQSEVKNIAEKYTVKYIEWTWSNRAETMNEWAYNATWDRLCFLHADSTLPNGTFDWMATQQPVWLIAFEKEFVPYHWFLTTVSNLKNYYVRNYWWFLWNNAITISRSTFDEVWWYPLVPLFEDYILAQTIKKLRIPFHIWPFITKTSARTYVNHWVYRTFFFMCKMRLLYWIWTPLDRLQKIYYWW